MNANVQVRINTSDVSTEPVTQALLSQAASVVGYASLDRYRARANALFAGVPLSGKTFLEVGCGKGAWAIWAALNGATHCIGLEPEVDGSTPGTLKRFRDNIAALGLGDIIESRQQTLQQFLCTETNVDVVMMYNVINHIDEFATTHMHEDERLQQPYIDVLKQLRARMNKNGAVIIADCGRTNLWPQLGMVAPWEPTIEWEKHQDPPMWTRVFRKAGFECQSSRWSPIYPFGALSANALVQYLTRSVFIITYRAA